MPNKQPVKHKTAASLDKKSGSLAYNRFEMQISQTLHMAIELYSNLNYLLVLDHHYDDISVTQELAPLLGEIFDFSVYLPNKDTGKVEMAPPAFTFMPYYIDQDKGWSGLYDSFASITQYKSADRIKSLYYHLNIYTKGTVELMAEKDRLKDHLEILEDERDRLNTILSALREETANLPPADTISELDTHLEAPKKRIEQLVTQIGEIRNKIQGLETVLQQHQYNLHVIQDYISAKDHATESDEHKFHVCPNCGYIFDEEIFNLVRSNYGTLNEDYICQQFVC